MKKFWYLFGRTTTIFPQVGNTTSHEFHFSGRIVLSLYVLIFAFLTFVFPCTTPNLAAQADGLTNEKQRLLNHLNRVKVDSHPANETITIYPIDRQTLQAVSTASCGGTATGELPNSRFTLSSDIKFISTEWLLCYDTHLITLEAVMGLVDSFGRGVLLTNAELGIQRNGL